MFFKLSVKVLGGQFAYILFKKVLNYTILLYLDSILAKIFGTPPYPLAVGTTN